MDNPHPLQQLRAPLPGPLTAEARDRDIAEPGLAQGLAGSKIPGLVRNVVTSIVVGAVFAGLVWYFDHQEGPPTSEAVSLTAQALGPAPRVGMPAPDFQLVGLDGNPVQLSALRGHPVWLTFWATWCPPCRAENPDIQAVYQAERENGLIVLAVNIGEEPGTVRGYADRTGLSFAIVLDRATEVAAMYRSVGIPTHYFIDADGVVRDWRIGSMSKKTMDRKVATILTASAAQPAGR